LVWALCLVVWLLPGGAYADDALPEPQGRIILTVSGNVSVTNHDGVAVFDRAMLKAMPQVTIRTTTPWLDGQSEFRGPLARDVLARAGARGERLVAHAINDYVVNIPRADVERFGVILALELNGKRMRIRDKGPLWIIYPWGEHTELQIGTYYERSVWQLKQLHVE